MKLGSSLDACLSVHQPTVLRSELSEQPLRERRKLKWLEESQHALLQRYLYVLIADLDEFFLPDPARYTSLPDYLSRRDHVAAGAAGIAGGMGGVGGWVGRCTDGWMERWPGLSIDLYRPARCLHVVCGEPVKGEHHSTVASRCPQARWSRRSATRSRRDLPPRRRSTGPDPCYGSGRGGHVRTAG